MSTKVSSPHRILCDSTAINRELTPLRCNSGSPTSLKKTKVVLSTSKVNIIETVNRTTNDSRSTSPSPVTSRTPPATNTSTAKDQLEDRITKLKSEVQHLKLSLRTTPTTEQLSDSEALSSSVPLITTALSHLCGNHVSFGPLFWMAFSSLCIITDTEHSLSIYQLWIYPVPRLTRLFSTVLDTLMFHYNSISPVIEYGNAWIAGFTPPNILWLFVHTADPFLLPQFRKAVHLQLDRYQGTQRGVALKVLANRLLSYDSPQTVQWQMWQRAHAEENNWCLPERRHDDLKRVGWKMVLEALPPKRAEKRMRNVEDDDVQMNESPVAQKRRA